MIKLGVSINLNWFGELNKAEVIKLVDMFIFEGIQHIEIKGFDYVEQGEYFKKYKDLLEVLKERINISIHFCAFASLMSIEYSKRHKWRNKFNKFLELAVDVKWLTMHMGEGELNSCADKYIEDLFRLLVEATELAGPVPIRIENSFQGTFQKKKEYGTKVEHFQTLFDLYKKKDNNLDLGLILDVGHLNLTQNLKLEDFSPFFKNVSAFHCHDNYGPGDEGGIYDPHRLVGMGTVDWKGFVNILNTYKFIDPVVIAENKTMEESIITIRALKDLFKI